MKKLIVLSIALLSLSFAVDYVGVNSGSVRGKFSKTSNPTFASVTTTTWNYTVTGNVTCNTLVVTSSAVIPAITLTSGTATALTITTATLPTIISNPTLNIQATAATSAATISTGNINIPIKYNGSIYYLKANTGL